MHLCRDLSASPGRIAHRNTSTDMFQIFTPRLQLAFFLSTVSFTQEKKFLFYLMKSNLPIFLSSFHAASNKPPPGLSSKTMLVSYREISASCVEKTTRYPRECLGDCVTRLLAMDVGPVPRLLFPSVYMGSHDPQHPLHIPWFCVKA